jgi:hypothetical protein
MKMEMEILKACGEASVMIMGMSFIIGSLFTIFILVLLDLYRSHQTASQNKD